MASTNVWCVSAYDWGSDLSEEGAVTPADTLFLMLAGFCVAGPYVLGVRPKARRHWLSPLCCLGVRTSYAQLKAA